MRRAQGAGSGHLFMTIFLGCITGLPIVPPPAAWAEDCVAFAKVGWFNRKEVSTDYARVFTFMMHLRSEQVKTWEQANQLGIDLAVPIEGIMVGLGYEATETDFRKFKNLDELTLREKLLEFYHHDVSSVEVSKDVTGLIDKCLQQNGVHFWMERGSTQELFVIPIHFEPYEGRTSTRVTVKAEHADCEPPRVKLSSKNGYSHTISCSRQEPFNQSDVVVVTSNAVMPDGTTV